MEQILDNLLVMRPFDAPIPPEGAEGSFIIYLAGSQDVNAGQVNPNGDPISKFDWQTNFIKACTEIFDRTSGKGLTPYNQFNYIIINPCYTPQNPTPNVMNPEYMEYKNWEASAMEASTGIFLNFLKRSTSPLPLFTLGYACQSGRLVCRCPETYQNYAMVRFYCQKYGVPLLPSKVSSVLSVLQSFFSFVDGFQQANKYALPE